MTNTTVPKLIEGGFFSDHRGEMCFVNDFMVNKTLRFYTIKHSDTSIVRAWQGHKIEHKYFFPLSGCFVVAWVEIDDFNNPSDNLVAHYTLLDAKKPAVLHIPNGFANGLKAISENALIGAFSDLNLEDSMKENQRYQASKWLDWNNNFEKQKINIIY